MKSIFLQLITSIILANCTTQPEKDLTTSSQFQEETDSLTTAKGYLNGMYQATSAGIYHLSHKKKPTPAK